MKPKYKHSAEDKKDRSPSVLVPLLISYFKPESIVDIGCGIGNWLDEFRKNGKSDLFGIDGFHLDKSLFLLDESKLLVTNLEEPFTLQRKFDLAISFEVAEHLSSDSADNFVKCLCRLSDNIVFSAAVPGQGGQNHINEQWPSYWVTKFKQHGFYFFDVIRPAIWNNEEVRYWYRQNMFIVSKNPNLNLQNDKTLIDIVHPEMLKGKLLELANGQYGIRTALKTLKKSIHFALNR